LRAAWDLELTCFLAKLCHGCLSAHVVAAGRHAVGIPATHGLLVGRPAVSFRYPVVARLPVLVFERGVRSAMGALAFAIRFHGAVVRFGVDGLGALIRPADGAWCVFSSWHIRSFWHRPCRLGGEAPHSQRFSSISSRQQTSDAAWGSAPLSTTR